MRIKPFFIVLSTVCAAQISFALPQVEDAGETSPSSDSMNNSSGYLASVGPVVIPDVSQGVKQPGVSIDEELLARLNALETEVQVLQGRVDELQHALKQSQTAAVQKSMAVTTTLNVDAQQEKAAYDTAYNLVSTKAYANAIEAFMAYLDTYPEGKYAANANYWLGELNANRQSYPAALQYLQVVVDKYSQSTKAPDALLKMGIINERLKNDAKAQALFNQLLSEYPDSSAAKSAKEYVHA